MDCENKVILITGASGGIGSAMVRGFAQKGFSVVINYLHSKKKAETLKDAVINQHGPDVAIAVQADVSNRSDVKRMFEAAYEKYGRLDVLINSAGVNIDRPFLAMTDDEWNKVIATILTGTFICSQEFASRFTGTEGHIINIGALTAIRGRKNGANYCSARAGVITLTRCLAQELAPKIRVNCVTPGWINTDEVMKRYQLHQKDNYNQTIHSIPLKRLGNPDDINRLIYFLVNESTYITGQNYLIDGGMLMY